MGFCTPAEYLEFMRQAPDVERMIVRSDIHLIKFWFSVSQSEQLTRFIIRQIDPVRQWKLSPMDIQSLDKWDDYTEAKEAMFFYTDTADAPWTVVKSNDKKRARLEAMRHVLARFDYPGKNAKLVGSPGREDHRAARAAVRAEVHACPSRSCNRRPAGGASKSWPATAVCGGKPAGRP